MQNRSVLQSKVFDRVTVFDRNSVRPGNKATELRRIDTQPPQLVKPQPQIASMPEPLRDSSSVQQSAAWSDETVIWDEAPIVHDETCDGCSFCDSGCDTYGCDSMGDGYSSRWWNSTLSFHPNRWFGSIELLLMFPKGDELPVLVTTTTDQIPNPNTAGRIGQPGTRSCSEANGYWMICAPAAD